VAALEKEKVDLATNVNSLETAYEELKNQDQLKKNQELQQELDNIKKTYKESVTVYEDLLNLKEKTNKTESLDNLYALALKTLSELNYSSAAATLDILKTSIKKENEKLVSQVSIPQNVPEKKDPPGSGYSRQSVVSEIGTFMVSLIAGDLSSTKVIVDTASASDCVNNCPSLSLGDYVSRNGAYAGVNGAYACPPEYPQCAGKTNSFDLLIMNKNKYYFNSSNNVYSTNPAVIFGGSYVRFVSKAQEWGRDTSVDSVLSNFPLLILGNQVQFSGNSDAKQSSKSNRGFVANRGNIVYIGIVHNATVAETAKVLSAMGMENAINLDGGGSAALWANGGYKVGPGRNLTNVILFLRK
jgi:hypothetical protein